MATLQEVISMTAAKFSMQQKFVAALAFGSHAAHALASTGDPGVIAMSQWSGDRLDQPGFLGISLLLLLVLALIGLVWINQAQFSYLGGLQFSKDYAAGNLFLGVKIEKVGHNSPGSLGSVDGVGDKLQSGNLGTAFVRELGLREALIVSPVKFEKNEDILVHLGSLPNFPQKSSDVRGVVRVCKPLGGDPPSFLIRVRFESDSNAPNYDLLKYLKNLAPKGGSPAHQA